MDTAMTMALAESGIDGTVESVCFAKGWNAAIAAAVMTCQQIVTSAEIGDGGLIVSAVSSLSDATTLPKPI